MACCSLLLYLLVRVRRRAGNSDRLPTSSVVTWTTRDRSGARTIPRAGLLVLTTVVEVGIAAGLAVWQLPSVFPQSSSGQPSRAAQPHELALMSGMTMSQDGQIPWAAVQNLIAVLVAIGGLLVADRIERARKQAWPARRQAAFALGVSALSFGVSGVASDLAMRTHTAMMLQFELLTVIGPLLLSVGLAPLTRPRFGNAPLALGLSTAATLAWSAMLVAWHLPSLDGSDDWGTARVVLAAACGMALWLVVVRPLSPLGISPRGRLARLLFAGEASGLVGLMMLLAPSPLFGASGSMHESLLDQRTAGALMMLVDLVFIAPTAFSLADWGVGSGRALAT